MPRSPFDDPFSDIYGDPFGNPFRPRPPVYTTAQQSNIIEDIAGGGLSALQWVGSVLDKTFGGRAIRGLLGGKPEELLSVLPMSDTIGDFTEKYLGTRIGTDPKNRVSGKDLLGIKGDDFWTDDLPGIAAEIALDPATYLTLGTTAALTSAGKAAAKSSTLAKTMAGRIAAGQSGLFGFGLPFRQASWVPEIATGPTAQKIAEQLGKFGNALKYSKAGQYGSYLFDPTVQDVTHPLFQQELRGSHHDFLRTAIPQERLKLAELYRAVHKAGIIDEKPIWQAIERGTPTGFAEVDRIIADEIRPFLQRRFGELQRSGIPISEAAEYAPRQRLLDPALQGTHQSSTFLQPKTSHQLAREEFLQAQGIPLNARGWSGTAALEEMAADPLIRNAPSDLGAAQHIIKNYGDPTWRELESLPNPSPGSPLDLILRNNPELREMALRGPLEREYLNPLSEVGEEAFLRSRQLSAQKQTFGQKAQQIAPFIRSVPEGQRIYAHPLESLLHYGYETSHALANARMMQNIFGRHAMPLANWMTPPTGIVPLEQALERAGISNVQGFPDLLDIIKKREFDIPDVGPEKLFGVPEELVSTAEQLGKRMYTTPTQKELLKGIDSATMLNKAFQTGMWPAHQIRNFMSDITSSVSKGASPIGLVEAQQIRRALGTGQPAKGLAARVPWLGATDAEATEALGNLLFTYQPGGRGTVYHDVGRSLSDIHGGRRTLSEAIPGIEPEGTFSQAIQSYWKGRTDKAGKSIDPVSQRLKPWAFEGFGGFMGVPEQQATKFGPGVAGSKMSAIEDAMTRDVTFIERLLSGHGPRSAADAATAAHFDYSALTEFERNVLRRLIPYYSWTRKNIPSVIGDIAQHPGGLYAQTIRAGSNIRDDEGYMPSYLGKGLAIPVGSEADGRKTFLSSLGLPFEDLLNMIPTGQAPVENALLYAGGQLNPLLKGPLEIMAGKNFYTNRELNDARSMTDSTVIDAILGATPASRFISIGKKLTRDTDAADKILNLLTGTSTWNVEMDAARRKAIRDLLNEYMENSPEFRKHLTYWVPEEQKAMLTPEQQAVLGLTRQLEREGKQRAKTK